MDTIRQYLSSDFLRHNAVFFAGSILVGIVNYLYYPALGRLMDPVSFGEVQTLVSLFLQFAILLNVLGLITVTIVREYSDIAAANKAIFELEKLAVYGALFLLGLSLLGGEFLKEQFHFQTASPFAALALTLLISIPLTFRSAYARSKKRFGLSSLSQLIGASIKLVLSVGLVILGLNTLGAIGGIVLAQFIAFLFAAHWAARLGFSLPKGTHYGRLPDLTAALPELRFAGYVLIGLLSVTLLLSIDVVVIKYFFDPVTAGLYAGVAAVARIIFFLAAPIAQVLIPLIGSGQSIQENHHLLIRSAGLTLIVCFPAFIICVLFPNFIVTALMGQSYLPYAHLLPSLALAVFIISFVNLFCMYFLAFRKKLVAGICIAGFILPFCSMLIWHDTPEAIINAMLIGGTASLLALIAYSAITKRGEK